MLVANSNLTLPGPAVFLFNGGEETVLQASHGFMAHSRCPLRSARFRVHSLRKGVSGTSGMSCSPSADAACLPRLQKCRSFLASWEPRRTRCLALRMQREA